MDVKLHSTSKIIKFNGIPCRIWEGITEGGVECHAYITRIAIKEDETPENAKQFEQELLEQKPPTPEVAAIPLRMII